MLFDSHAHMDVEEFADDRDELLERIHADKISYVVNPGVDLGNIDRRDRAGAEI